MTREEIKKQWELEFGAKYEEYQRANVFTAIDILDFAESVVNKLLISGVSQQRELLLALLEWMDYGCKEDKEHILNTFLKDYKANNCG